MYTGPRILKPIDIIQRLQVDAIDASRIPPRVLNLFESGAKEEEDSHQEDADVKELTLGKNEERTLSRKQRDTQRSTHFHSKTASFGITGPTRLFSCNEGVPGTFPKPL